MRALRLSATLATTAVCLTLVACGDQPAGEPVVRTKLGEEPVDIVPPALAEPNPAAMPEAPQRASACTDLRFEEAALTHCVADPAEHRIAVTYGPGDGSTPFGTLADFADTIEDTAEIAFAMNGGAFSDDLSARGYLVAGGARLSELNRADGEGNFFLKPGGVFFGTGGTWRVLTTDRFYSTVRDRPQFGTQSGPMLLIDGALHPQIAENGPSRAIRNGVGV
ncbi:MAG: phosphodiester glycosidase family protein, partial [Pseudomonadota bacterium]